MKKITITVLFIMFGAIITPFSIAPAIVHAEDGKRGIENKSEGDSLDNSGGNEDQGDEQDSEEHDVFSLLSQDQAKAPQLVLPTIDEKTIVTYADIVTVIKSYEAAISQLDASAGIDTQSTTLTPAEKTLLDGLLSKHKSHLNHLDSRITETSAQLKALEDLLTPLGTQSISSSFGIRGLLISELNNYRDILTGISEFDGLTKDILEQETD